MQKKKKKQNQKKKEADWFVRVERLVFSTGVGMALRKMGNMVKPTLTIEIKDGKVVMRNSSTFKTTEISFTLGEEFDETTADGRAVKVNGQDLLSPGGGWFKGIFLVWFFFCCCCC